MKFHPQKCQVVHISNKRNPKHMLYSIHGHTLERTISVTEKLNHLQWHVLQEKRPKAKVIMMYRIAYNWFDIPSTSLTARASTRYHKRYLTCTIRSYPYLPPSIRMWNSCWLPYHR
ncbi:hypothetical protein MAR_013775 [Mya arenaria]|uniref:Uncharacterized protein n=1 Tax=Mya arenaria TaxID=6604 RepID=A0ABY7G4V9_MYAAR|nr:hypothetical protein MAR_013775 [Mya arenaria]